MGIPIKYPKKKFVEAENISDLQKQLKVLMIEEFDIKNLELKLPSDIKTGIKTTNISQSDLNLLLENNYVIIPTIITQCRI